MKNDNVFDHGRRKMLGSTAKTLAGGMALSPVSYTHLTLPTIYSV